MRVRLTVLPVDGLGSPADLVVDCATGTPWSALTQALTAKGWPSQNAWVDGAPLSPDMAVGMPPLLHGAVIRPGPPFPERASSRWTLRVVSGPAAGAEHDLTPGRIVIGRGPRAGIVVDDPEVSRRHAELDVGSEGVAIRDLGSANGTTKDGELIRLGGSTLRIADRHDRATAIPSTPDHDGRLVVNIPPPLHRPAATTRIDLPAEPQDQPMTAASWIGVLTPVLVAVPLALRYGAELLIVTLVAPLVAVIGLVADRTRRTRRRRRAHRDWTRMQAASTAAIEHGLAAELARRVEVAPDVGALLSMAARETAGLWQRRPTDPDFLRLRIGTAELPTELTVHRPDGEVDHRTLRAAPVTVSLADHRALGIAGPRHQALGLARFLVAQLAVLHQPGVVAITFAAVPDTSRAWHWLRWLPQVDPAPVTVLVADGDHRSVDAGSAVHLAATRTGLPAQCDAVIEFSGGESVRVSLTAAGIEPIADIIPDVVSLEWAGRCARALAPLRARNSTTRPDLPETIGLADLLDGNPLDAAAVIGHWRDPSRGPAAVLGAAASGPYTIDLHRDGPHILVAGTTGAGKSELLRTLVAGLALSMPPDELAFVLVDYKGGAAFGDCAELPHTVGLVTDLDRQVTQRALTGLDAELRRRERLLAEAAAPDLDSYVRRAPPGLPAIARLVIVVDEFATLVEDLPDFVAGLVSIARRGRSLGIHLVLATQRPAGIVTGDIRANVGLRVALRVTEPGDSTDVIGVPDAAAIPDRTPGRAIVRTGAGALVHVQTARVAGSAKACELSVHVVAPDESGPPYALSDGLDLGELSAALRSVADRLGIAPAAAPWLEALPERLTLADLDAGDLDAGDLDDGRLPIGLIDLPADQRRARLTVDLAAGGHWLVIGGSGSGKTTTVRTVITQLATKLGLAAAHVYVISTGATLADAATLPQCGAVAAAGEVRRVDRLLLRLSEEIDRRRGQATRLPWLLLVVDGWGEFAEAADTVDHGRPIATLRRLMRDGTAAGLTAMITGDRDVLTARVSAYAANRLVLRLDDAADYAGAGLTTRALPNEPPPGRGVLAPNGQLVQVALPTGDLREITLRDRPTAAGPRPFRVEPLPTRVGVDDLTDAGGGHLWVPLGLGGDELQTLGVDLAGGVLLVAGGRRSGRTTVVRIISRWCAKTNVEITTVTRDSMPTPPKRPTLFVVDDVESIAGTAVDDALTLSLGVAASCGESYGAVVTGLPDTFAHAYRGIAAAARHDRCALLLGPPSAADTELAGVRVSKDDHPVPGRGVLVVDGTVTDIQVATAPSND